MSEALATVVCMDCAHLRLKDAGPMGQMGFGLCAARGATYQFMSSVYPRQCAQFAAGPADVVAARRAWADAQRGEG